MDLSVAEFDRKNLFINAVMVMKHKNPNAFYKDYERYKVTLSKSSSEDEGILSCIISTILLVSAVAGLSSCVTVFLCGIAILGFGYAFNSWMDECVG